MSDKEKIEQLEKEIEELKSASEYYKGECNSFWADLRKRQNFNLEIAQKIVKTDSKAIANIILNMYFGKMPSDSCGFCEIFGLKEKGCCKEDLRCTDCIDNFLKQHYSRENQAVCRRMGEKGRMGNDLIGRSALLEKMTDRLFKSELHEYQHYQNMVKNMPTAYDVDKVAFRLECESINCHIMTDRAVEIVKSGGIE